ncbi:MAG TPA: SCP2 sterol-binding domain-containing protein [Acidimicrobiales bacterium]
MVPFPSESWFDEAGAVLAGDAQLARLSHGAHLVVQQTVTGPDDTTVWHVQLDDGAVSLHRGPADDPTVTFTCDRETAQGIHLGTTSAQSAFMAGRLRVGGDVGALLRHQQLLGSLTDLLGPLRSGVA